MRRTRTAAGSTCCSVKHPNGNFQKPVRPAAGEIAPKHCIAGLVDHRMDIDRSAEPGMPRIKNLALVSNVGVLAFSCTMPSGRIRRSETRRHCKRAERLSNLRAPRPARLPKPKPMIIKIKPADSRYERGTEGGQVICRADRLRRDAARKFRWERVRHVPALPQECS